MAEISFAEDRKTIRAALARALSEEAQHRSLSVDPALFEHIAAAFDAQNDSPPGLPPPSRADLSPIFGNSPPLALLLFDTPGIQDYLFKVSGPIDLFGGSRQVADFTEGGKDLSIFSRLAPPWPIRERNVFAGGSSGLLLASASEAAELAGRIESILVEATAGDLRSYAAFVPVWPDEILAHPGDESLARLLFPAQPCQGSKPPSAYAAVLASLLQELQRRRNQQQPWPARQNVEAQFSRCEACGDRPGSRERKRGEDLEKLCPSCHSRWKYGQAQRGKFDEKRTFEALLEGIDPAVTALAVIYADGANAGDLFARVDTPARHRSLSRAVGNALEAAAKAVRDRVESNFGKEDELRCQTAIQGGDDLVMVLPARGALEATRLLVEAFERSIDAALETAAFANAPEKLRKALGRFGLGVGIAVGDLHFPIQFLLSYASDLLKNAKKLTRASTKQRSAVDFLVLRGGTPLSSSIGDLRSKYLQQGDEKKDALRYYTRPLGLTEFGDFLKRTEILRTEVPRAQIQAIRRELLRGRQLSLSLWRYQQARSDDWANWRKALGIPSLSTIDDHLWRREGNAWVTDFFEQIEVLDLLDLKSPEKQAAESRND